MPTEKCEGMTGYQEDFSRTLADVAQLVQRVRAEPRDVSTKVRLAYRRYHLANLTGDEAHFDRAREVTNQLLEALGPREDLSFLKAQIEGRYHRLDLVKEALQTCPSLAGRPEGRSIKADIDFQEGRYGKAREALEALIDERDAWDDLARLAHLKSRMGERDEADALLLRAEEQLSAKEMPSYAWLELERGALALSRGNHSQAGHHYDRASRAFPGHWRIDAHIVEWLLEEERDEEAVALMRSVVTRASKPELQQAFGEILVLVGRDEEAAPYFHAAENAYLASLETGGVHTYHHLADYYGGVGSRPDEALAYARKDLALRDNFTTQSALAWCLLKTGQIEEGIAQIQHALDSGVCMASIFITAAELHHAAGHAGQAESLAARAKALSPCPQRFHMHI